MCLTQVDKGNCALDDNKAVKWLYEKQLLSALMLIGRCGERWLRQTWKKAMKGEKTASRLTSVKTFLFGKIYHFYNLCFKMFFLADDTFIWQVQYLPFSQLWSCVIFLMHSIFAFTLKVIPLRGSCTWSCEGFNGLSTSNKSPTLWKQGQRFGPITPNWGMQPGWWSDLKRSKLLRVELTRGVSSVAWEEDKGIRREWCPRHPWRLVLGACDLCRFGGVQDGLVKSPLCFCVMTTQLVQLADIIELLVKTADFL